MKKTPLKKSIIYFFKILILFCVLNSYAQKNIWQEIDYLETDTRIDKDSDLVIKQFYKLQAQSLQNLLVNSPDRFNSKNSSVLLSLPSIDGTFETYKVFKASNFHPELSEKYPSIQTYIARSLNSDKIARFSYDDYQGLQVFISDYEHPTIFIKPTDLNKNIYALSVKNNDSVEFSDFECSTIQETRSRLNNNDSFNLNADDGNLRLFRAAVTTTGEYSQFFLDGTEVDDAERISKVLAAINTSLTRINGIFERDFSISMQLVANNNQIIYLDANTDPYSEPSNDTVQNTIDTIIGNSNYDVGHLFAYEGNIYGNAGCIACVCTTGSKGSAYTVHSAPDSDDFNMIASHEYGHQFGGWHVQSSTNCRSANELNEVEPGSGSTIMGYAGICPANVQNSPDDYFNYVNIRDITEWTINGSSCAQVISISNNAPTADAGSDYIVPISTALVLEGTASDTDVADVLSYTWEQNNPENPFSSNSPSSTRVNGPMFRSFLPTNNTKRYLPSLSDVITGNLTPTWEVIPSVARTMNFVFTVRDNALGGGQTASDEMMIEVNNSAGPFTVTSQTTSETWNVGENKLITWDVSNTDIAPINTTNVDIFLSVDGGYTYPYIILNGTANDGSETITIPNVPITNTARIMVKAANNIFYAINPADITIQASEFVMNFNDTQVSVCQPNDAIFNFTYETFLGFNEVTAFSVDNLPAGLTAVFNPPTAIANGTNVTLTISNTSSLAPESYDFSVKGTSTSVDRNVQTNLSLFNNTISSPTLISPADTATGVDISLTFEWQDDVNASSYEFQIALDSAFSNIINTNTTENNQYDLNVLNSDTTYYWRVKSINLCGQSNFSDVFSFTTACVEPTNLSVDNILSDSVEVFWTDDGNATSWELEYGLTGFTQGTGTVIQTSDNPYTLPTLNSFTDYDIYLRSNCSGPNTSTWVGPLTFTTLPDYCSGDHFYDSGGVNGNYSNNEDITTIIYPSIGFNSITVQFNSFNIENGWDFLYVYNGEDINSPSLGIFTGSNIGTGTFTSNNPSGALTFRFISDGSVTYGGWDATVICEFITCPNPNNVVTSNITDEGVDLSWDAGSTETQWEIEYGITGFTQGTGTVVQTSTNPHPLTGLNALTAYDVYLRANCGANPNDDDSNWVGPVTFTTLPDYCSGDHFYDSGGVNGNYSNSEDITIVIYPSIGFNSVTVQFNSFNIENGWDFLYVYNGEDINSPSLGVFTGSNIGTGTFISNNSSGALTFRFTSDSIINSTGWDATVICEFITCPNPNNLVTSNITGESVDLSWDAGSTETQWEIEYGITGFPQGTGTVVQTSTNPHPLTGLNALTAYDVYLRANCGANPGDDDSHWVGPVTFTTTCGVYLAPIYEHFDTITIPDCWEEHGSENWNFNLGSNYDAASAGDHTPNQNTYYAWIDGSTPNGSEHVSHLKTMTIDVSQLTIPALQFSVFSVNNNDLTYNTLNVVVSNALDEVENVLNLQGSTSGWTTYTIDLTTISTNSSLIKIDFSIEENSPGLSYYNDILIDDVIIDEFNILGTNDFDINGFSYYPNPVANTLNINYTQVIDKIEIYSLLGQRLMMIKPNDTTSQIDMSPFNSGSYFVNIYSGLSKKVIKIIKTKNN